MTLSHPSERGDMSDHLKNLHPRLTTSEVCALARWTVRTFQRRRRDGEFTVQSCGRGLGGELLFPRDEVLRALNLVPHEEPPVVVPVKPLISVDKLKALDDTRRRKRRG